MKVIARTPRLLLRELSEEDLGSLGGTLMDAEAMAALGGAMDREQALTWLRRQIGRYRTGEPACWGVEERETGTPAGLAGFARMPTPLGSCPSSATSCAPTGGDAATRPRRAAPVWNTGSGRLGCPVPAR